jgi:hypothetical protein
MTRKASQGCAHLFSVSIRLWIPFTSQAMFLPNGSSLDNTPVGIGLGGLDSVNEFWLFEPGKPSFLSMRSCSHTFRQVTTWSVGEKNMRGVPGAPDEKA